MQSCKQSRWLGMKIFLERMHSMNELILILQNIMMMMVTVHNTCTEENITSDSNLDNSEMVRENVYKSDNANNAA